MTLAGGPSPVKLLIGFLDVKVFSICRPSRFSLAPTAFLCLTAPFYSDDLEPILDEALVQDFNTEAEDGSILEVRSCAVAVSLQHVQDKWCKFRMLCLHFLLVRCKED